MATILGCSSERLAAMRQEASEKLERELSWCGRHIVRRPVGIFDQIGQQAVAVANVAACVFCHTNLLHQGLGAAAAVSIQILMSASADAGAKRTETVGEAIGPRIADVFCNRRPSYVEGESLWTQFWRDPGGYMQTTVDMTRNLFVADKKDA